MLKSFSTQLAATAFFGPIGLAYTSMATAVLFTLILAVLYFTGFGALAILVIWPVSIVTGVLYVKFHNDRLRQSGNSLLLGPGQDDDLVSTVGSWARGVVVIAVICGFGYLAYAGLPFGADATTLPGRIVSDTERADIAEPAADTVADDTAAADTDTMDTDSQVVLTASEEEAIDSDSSSVPVITLTSRDIPKVIVDSSGKATTATAGQSEIGDSGAGNNGIVAQPLLYVDRDVVNLRQGPGTEYAIVTQLDRGETLLEFARDGDWVNIETEAGNYAGWIHGNLVRR